MAEKLVNNILLPFHLVADPVTGEAMMLRATPTDRSGTIAVGGTAQVLLAANIARRGYWLQNLSSGDLWVSELGDAAPTAPSLKVPPNALYESPPNGAPDTAISVYGAADGQSFSAREW